MSISRLSAALAIAVVAAVSVSASPSSVLAQSSARMDAPQSGRDRLTAWLNQEVARHTAARRDVVAAITTEGDTITVGAGALDSMVAKASAKAGIAGLEFYAGIPGTIGGALTMNAGCYGSETKDVLVSAWGLTRQGERIELALADFGYTYRHSNAPADIIWIEATWRGTPDAPEAVAARIQEITERREKTQPIREKTGGSTFKNPEGQSSWKLVDEAGWRGKLHAETGGGAKFSELHSNFMINPGEATAADIEGLGETVRADVLLKTGVQLDWEIKRIGRRVV